MPADSPLGFQHVHTFSTTNHTHRENFIHANDAAGTGATSEGEGDGAEFAVAAAAEEDLTTYLEATAAAAE
jgi:hypothetical protein